MTQSDEKENQNELVIVEVPIKQLTEEEIEAMKRKLKEDLSKHNYQDLKDEQLS